MSWLELAAMMYVIGSVAGFVALVIVSVGLYQVHRKRKG